MGEVPQDRRYTPDHLWVDAQGRVGITAYGAAALGDVVFVELPAVGQAIGAGERFGTVESVKSTAELKSPVDGTVTAVNAKIHDHPELINEDPYGEGWLITVAVSRTGALLAPAEYAHQVETASP
ncbi:MAG: glycine cleavage system protein GcvH [Firmicutes bacterium]|nr:glycine cleavage system protein GcvH [Alicyclobacillaceae bacterium]MCL6496659.1 glycine cleavage system protein GcvH [Bacillota bacterium]